MEVTPYYEKYLLVSACAAVLLIAAALIYISPGNKTAVTASEDTSKPKVITTIFPQYDLRARSAAIK